MKSILISIKPEWVAKILNGEKTIEIRKTAPKCELPIDVYIYCTHGYKLNDLRKENIGIEFGISKSKSNNVIWLIPPIINGKVVAKFTLREVEEIKFHILTKTNTYGIQRTEATFTAKTLSYRELTKLSCLAGDYLMEYLNDTDGYAWHISDLQIFDKPRELSDFKQSKLPWPDKVKRGIPWEEKYYYALGKFHTEHLGKNKTINEIRDEFDKSISIKHAPQSWCYVEN